MFIALTFMAPAPPPLFLSRGATPDVPQIRTVPLLRPTTTRRTLSRLRGSSQAKESLSNSASSKQFSFNELHIFGKFELFCKRIQKLIDVFTTIEQFTSLSAYNIDGMETLINRFFEIVDELKRKTSDLLDYTKPAFDKDYIEFNKSIQELESSLQVWGSGICST